jgi:hypothetical protein
MHCLWVGVRLGGRLKQPLRLQRFIRAREPSLSIATHSSGKELHITASFLSVLSSTSHFLFYGYSWCCTLFSSSPSLYQVYQDLSWTSSIKTYYSHKHQNGLQDQPRSSTYRASRTHRTLCHNEPLYPRNICAYSCRLQQATNFQPLVASTMATTL